MREEGRQGRIRVSMAGATGKATGEASLACCFDTKERWCSRLSSSKRKRGSRRSIRLSISKSARASAAAYASAQAARSASSTRGAASAAAANGENGARLGH